MTDKLFFYAVLAIIPTSMLLVAEYLPQAFIPLNPTYLKYFAAQSIALIAVILLLLQNNSTSSSAIQEEKRPDLQFAFPIILVLFAGWNLLSLMWADWWFGATNLLLHSTTYWLVAILFYFAISSPGRFKLLAKLFFLSALVATIWQFQAMVRATAANDNLALARAFLKRPFMFGNVNFSCSTLITGGLLAVSFFATSVRALRVAPHKSSVRQKGLTLALCLLALLLFATLLLLTRSLAGYIAGAVGLCTYIICLLPSSKLQIILSSIVVLAATLTLMVILYVPQYRHRTLNWALQKGSTTRARMVWWTATADMFTARPILGWGIGSYGSVYYDYAPPISDMGPPTRGVAATHPHNEFLRIAAELGVPGVILYFLLFIVTLVTSYRRLSSSPFPVKSIGFALWAGAVAYLTQAALGKGIQAWDMALPFWIVTGSLAATHRWQNTAADTAPFNLPRWSLLVFTPLLGLWWVTGGLSGYKSLINLKHAHDRVNGIASYIREKRSTVSKQHLQEPIIRVSKEIDAYLKSSRPHCPIPTVPLRIRYSLAINLTSIDLHHRACREFQKTHAMAPGFLQVRKFLALCNLRSGNKKRAQKLLIKFLQHHPTRTEGYVYLARLNLPAATDRLAQQVLERDHLSDKKRAATLAQMMTALNRWDDLTTLLQLAGKYASQQVYTAIGTEIQRTSLRANKTTKLQALRQKFPDAFPDQLPNNSSETRP